jgi:hypothetical protein
MSAGERPQTYVLDRAATGTGVVKYYIYKIFIFEYNISINPYTANVENRVSS